MWLWMGVIAAAGSTINYGIWIVYTSRESTQEGEHAAAEDTAGVDAVVENAPR